MADEAIPATANLLDTRSMSYLAGGSAGVLLDAFQALAAQAKRFNAARVTSTVNWQDCNEDGDEVDGEYVPEVVLVVRRP